MFSPTSTDEFDRRVAFYRAVGVSQGHSVLTMALIRNTFPPRDRPAVRAARLLVMRSSGRWRRERLESERAAFDAQ